MDKSMQAIDPEWAWSPFEPSAKSPWDERAIAHLYRRAGFAASDSDIAAAQQQTPQEVVRRLTYQHMENLGFERSANNLAKTLLAGGNPEQLSAAWVYRMMHTPNQLLEKATLFWHGHFATSAAKVKDARLMWQQSQLLREQALGSFSQLVHGIAQDPAMLIYLDSTSNRKSHPNENFARELMELFCLGEGNYSEADVQELARCFTGWEIKNGRFRKNRYQQDRGSKSVLGVAAKMDGEQAIDVVLSKDSAPIFVVQKLARFFLRDEPKLHETLLEPLAAEFRSKELKTAALIERILSSNFFFSTSIRARKVRSPVELCLGVLRALDATTNTVKLAAGLRKLGQGLFYPPNVKGWDGGRAWINSATLLARANLLDQILHDETTKFSGGTLAEFFEAKQMDDRGIVNWLESRLLAVPLSADTKMRLLTLSKVSKEGRDAGLRRMLQTCFSLPEFQLG